MSNEPGQSLSVKERGWIFVASAVALALSLWLTFCPGREVTEKRDGAGQITETVETPKDRNDVAMLIYTSALILFFWGVNGLRLLRITVGPVSAEAKSAEEKAAQAYANTEQEPKEVSVAEKKPVDEIEPRKEAKGSVVIANEAEAVYPLTAVPMTVINDLLTHWPKDIPSPKDLSTFEFAARKTGRGNYPWIIKFKDAPAIRVSYGGYGKETPTVASSAG